MSREFFCSFKSVIHKWKGESPGRGPDESLSFRRAQGRTPRQPVLDICTAPTYCSSGLAGGQLRVPKENIFMFICHSIPISLLKTSLLQFVSEGRLFEETSSFWENSKEEVSTDCISFRYSPLITLCYGTGLPAEQSGAYGNTSSSKCFTSCEFQNVTHPYVRWCLNTPNTWRLSNTAPAG